MQIIRGTNFKHFVWWWSWFIANLFLCVVFWEGLLRTKEMPDCWISSLRGLPNVDFVRFQCITWQTAGHSSSTQWHPVWSSNLNHILKIILLFYGYWLRSCFPQCLFKKEKLFELRAKIMCPWCISVHLHSVSSWLPSTYNGSRSFLVVPIIQNNDLNLIRWMKLLHTAFCFSKCSHRLVQLCLGMTEM